MINLCDRDCDFSFKLDGSCKGCFVDFKKKDFYKLSDVVPKGLCHFAYFSIIPYWVSLAQGSYFPWRKMKNDVTCQCPKSGGIVFLIKKNTTGGRRDIVEAEIINNVQRICPYEYQVGQKFQIPNETFCPGLFPSLWVLFCGLAARSSVASTIDCCVSPVSFKVALR